MPWHRRDALFKRRVIAESRLSLDRSHGNCLCSTYMSGSGAPRGRMRLLRVDEIPAGGCGPNNLLKKGLFPVWHRCTGFQPVKGRAGSPRHTFLNGLLRHLTESLSAARARLCPRQIKRLPNHLRIAA